METNKKARNRKPSKQHVVAVKVAVSAALKLELSLRMAKERAERQSELAAANIALLQVDLKSAWSKVAEAAQHAQDAVA